MTAFGVFVVACQVLTAIGIVAYWASWLRSSHAEAWLPAGFVEHERPFLLPDSLLATMLASSAVLLLSGTTAAGETIALLAAGMLIFLSLVDVAYYARHRMFEIGHRGLANAFVVVGTLITAGLMVVAALTGAWS